MDEDSWYFKLLLILIVLIAIGALVFWVMTLIGMTPCSKPVLEAPSWCISG